MLVRKIPGHEETPEAMLISLIDTDNMAIRDNVTVVDNDENGRWQARKAMHTTTQLLNGEASFDVRILNMN